MLTRRRFAALSAATVAALAAPLRLRAAAATRSGLEFGVQLYTLRSQIADLAADLKLIHDIGYSYVEIFPGVYGHSAAELKKMLADNGLRAPSGHFDYDKIADRIDFAKAVGLEYMVCPMVPRPQWDSAAGFRQAVKHFNELSPKVKAAGMTLAYHPHNYEFKPIEGTSGFDILMNELDPAVKLELDIYWATEAGKNPVELMNKHRDRLAMLHLKDRKPVSESSFVPGPKAAHFTEAGSGTIDFKAVLGTARNLGVKYMFVEQDQTDLPVDQSLRKSWKFLSQVAL